MKVFSFILLICSITVFAQEDTYWYAFHIEDTIENPLSQSLGFKDSKGNVKVKPIFISPMTENKKFEKIVALTEYSRGNSKSYYLNKQGKKFGVDSLYTLDFSHDTEQEGFIRFSIGHYLDSIGLFNANGKVVIAPKYNSLSKVKNGLVLAKIGAKQVHENHHSGCDHWRFEGGKEMLLDTLGNVLVADFNDNELALNFYSLKITTSKNEEKFRHSFKGENGTYYSFINYKEEFEHFILHDFLKNTTQKNIDKFLFTPIPVNSSNSKSSASKKNLLKTIAAFKNNKVNFNPYYFMYIDYENQEEFNLMEKYLDNAYSFNYGKYPMFEIETTNNSETITLSFIRTDNGYKLNNYKLEILNLDLKKMPPLPLPPPTITILED